MKIVFNIEKKHLIFLSIFLVLISAGFVIAIDNPKVFHDYLYTDIIKSHSEDNIIEIEGAALKVSAGEDKGISFGTPDDNFRIYATVGKMYYGKEGAQQTRHTFNGIIVSDSICDKEMNCISMEQLIDNNKFARFYEIEYGGQSALKNYKIQGQLTITGDDPNRGMRSAKTFCLAKNYRDAIEFTSTGCPTLTTPTVFNRQGMGKATFNFVHSGCIEEYGILNSVTCV